MLFVGIDLAWSKKNSTGIAVLEGNRKAAKLRCAGTVLSDQEIIDYVKKEVADNNAFIAIDAPLIVPNEKGRRIAEVAVGELFRKYDAGAHPANRQRLSAWSGEIRGEEISKLLENEKFRHNPFIRKFENSRKFFEVYPHPSMVVLFKLDKILRYKAKQKRDYKSRWREFKKYHAELKKLGNSSPRLVLPSEILEKDVRKLRAKHLKQYEDLLDAIFCAYIAYYAWAKPGNCAVLGNMKGGYILTPVFEEMKERITKSKKDV